jgi:hypothetical protein
MMLRFYPHKFIGLMHGLERLSNAIPDDDMVVSVDERSLYVEKLKLLSHLALVHDICDEAKLPGIKGQTRRIMNSFTVGVTPVRHSDLRRTLTALQERIYDSLEELMCLQIPSQKADYYNKSDLFGDDVTFHFRSANYDIEEAGKCFAVGRYTACVFHLMRVMEIGTKGFAQALGVLGKIKTAQSSWGQILSLTNEEIKIRNKGSDPSWVSQKSFFENVQSDLSVVKNAWRNPTMHVENQYDEERAEDIFNSVKGFMRHLAKHLDENGNYRP